MPARRRYIDPLTGDYSIEPADIEEVLGKRRTVSAAKLKDDDSHVSQVVFLLRLRRGSLSVAPHLGNEMYEKLEKLDETAEVQVERYCRNALALLVRQRKIRDLDIQATILDAGSVYADVSFVDESGTERTINNLELR